MDDKKELRDVDKSKEQLISELDYLRHRLSLIDKDLPADQDNVDLIRRFAENFHGVIFIIHKDGIFRMSEGRGLKDLDLQSGQVVGLSVYEVYKDNSKIKEIVGKALSGEEINDIVEVGSLQFETNFQPLKDKYGNITDVLGVALNVTESKKTEQDLREAREFLETALSQSPSGILIADAPDVKIRLANQAAFDIRKGNHTKLTGIDVSQHSIRWKTFKADGTQYPTEELPLSRAVLKGETTREEEIILRDEDEVDHWVSVNAAPIRDANGKITAGIVIFHDITERIKTEQALRKSEERFRRLFNDLGDAVFVTMVGGSNQGEILEVNPTAEYQTGYSRDELIGMNIFEDLTVEHTMQVDLDEGEQKLREGEAVSTIELKRKKDGTEYWTEVVVTYIDYKGQKAGLSINHDITNRKRLEDQLRQSQKMEAIGQLAGGIAHDFNNLLTVINGYCDLLNMRDLQPGISEPIAQIQNAGQRATQLTSQLLAFSRKQIIQPKILNLNSIISDYMKMLSRLLGEDIEVATVLKQDLKNIKADPGQIEQIIMNISINARSAMPFGGKLIIETDNVQFDQEYVDLHAEAKAGKYVMLAISDTGIGMDEETKSRIFEPFFTTKGREEGTGLGLATVYGIVRQNNGFIYVYSEPDVGTTFKVYLHRAESPDSDTCSSVHSFDKLKGSEIILLVEDDPAVREVTRAALEGYGYKVYSATNGEEALRVFKSKRNEINLLLTDVVMPLMSGPELVEQVLLDKPETMVIYFSGYTDNSIVHHGVLDEGTEFIQKPYAHIDLAKKIREILDRR